MNSENNRNTCTLVMFRKCWLLRLKWYDKNLKTMSKILFD